METVTIRRGQDSSGRLRQKIFNVIGWVAFILLVPPILHMFHLKQLQNFLVDSLGAWGSQTALVGYFYALLLFRVFFGSDQRLVTVFIGYAMSFLLFSNALDIGFMTWFYELLHTYPFLQYDVISLSLAILVVFATNLMSSSAKVSLAADIIVLVVLPIAVLVLLGLFVAGPIGLKSYPARRG